jgi:hypothetical protein
MKRMTAIYCKQWTEMDEIIKSISRLGKMRRAYHEDQIWKFIEF